MPKFGSTSLSRLETCHPELQRLFNFVVGYVDCTVLCGHRTEDEQNRVYREGKSKLKFPHSKHNQLPSIAADVAPWPLDWYDLDRFYFFGGFVIACAIHLEINIRWGGDWNGNFNFKDQNFNDLPHFELIL